MKPIIKVEGLGKEYRIGARPAARYGTLRDAIASASRAPLELLRRRGGRGGAGETLWALKDVSFDVMPGEVVGLVGRNGAGKSTLLKVLSRITEPTRGRVLLYGRIASLLEVGTGFHPELSGRENIFLNGAILGMGKAEIEGKFDEIVAFAEVEQFLDTPVKRYSSGMFVRLAFAVAAHLEPEILVVDEVLAVGDAGFQKKCLDKMGEVARGGRTVLFVSHNMGAVVSLCSRGILIDKGEVVNDGAAAQVAESYQAGLHSVAYSTTDLSAAERYGTGKARFTSIEIAGVGADNLSRTFLRTGEDLKVSLTILAREEIRDANVAVVVYDSIGYRLIDANTAIKGSFLSLGRDQEARVTFHLRDVLLKPGLYLVGVWLGRKNMENIDGITYAASISVEADPETVTGVESFPGAYQCRYTHAISVGEASPVPAG